MTDEITTGDLVFGNDFTCQSLEKYFWSIAKHEQSIRPSNAPEEFVDRHASLINEFAARELRGDK